MEQHGMDGSYKSSKGNKKPKNFLLNTVEKFLQREDNVSPASQFIKRQQKLKNRLNQLNDN